MSQPKPSYTRDLEVLAELAEFGADLTSRFEEAWPVLSRLLVINDSSNTMIKSLKFSVHGMFQQIRFDSTLPAPSINTHNNYRRLEDCIKSGGMVKLLLTYPELNVLKSLTDIACDCYGAFTNTNPEMPPTLAPDLMIGRLSEILDGLMLAAERLGVPLLSVGIRYPKLETLLRQYWAKRAEDEIKEAESTMPIPLFALPSEHQVKALTRAALVDLLASPEAATALKALGYTTVGPTLPPPTLRGLVEALRAATTEPKPEPEPEPVFTNESNVVKAIYGEVSRLKIKDLVLAHSPFEWPNGFLVEWRSWSDHSGTPNYIQVIPNSGVLGGPPGIHVNLIARANGGPVQVGSMSCRPDLQDFLHAAATLYAGALDQLGVNRATIKASPGSFAQDVSTATPLGPWDDAPEKDGFDPLDYPPF